LDARPGDKELKILEAEPLGRGAFSVEPGHVGQAALRIQGQDGSLLIDYDPAGGVVYAEQDGTPVPADAPAELVVRQQKTLRKELEGKAVPITDRDGTVLAVARRRPSRIEDQRRLPEFDDLTKWHATGQAHYDASPVPDGHIWTIRTDASPQDLKEAARRTLPAGTIYRHIREEKAPQRLEEEEEEEEQEHVLKTDFSDPLNSGYITII
jgi:hypothetical protein